MKICIVTEYFPPRIIGGGEYSAYLYARGLAREGCEVHVLTSHPRHSVPPVSDVPIHENKEGIYIHRILGVKAIRWRKFDLSGISGNELFFLHSLFAIVSFVIEEKPDIIHALNIHSIPSSVVAAKICKVPVVVTYNSFGMTCPKGDRLQPDRGFCDESLSASACFSCMKKFGRAYGQNRLDKFKIMFPLMFLYQYFWCSLFGTFLKMSDKVIAICTNTRNILIQNSLTSNKLEIIPVPVDIHNIGNRKTIRRKYGFPEKEPIILSVAALFGSIKGSNFLINAVPTVLEMVPNAKFLIVGHVPPTERELMKERKLQNHIILLGYVPRERIWDIYVASDVVLCLERRGVGRVLLEAMSMGKPVIAPNFKGIKQIIEDKKNGILVNPNKEREIGEAIARLINDKELAKRIGESARKTIGEKFSEETTARNIINVYNELLRVSG